MSGPVSSYGTQIGRQFWVSENSSVFGRQNAVKTALNAVSKLVGKGKIKPPDTSFVNFVRTGGAERFQSVVDSAERFARHAPAEQDPFSAAVDAHKTAREFGIGNFDEFARRLAMTARKKFPAVHQGRSEDETHLLATKALEMLFSMDETKALVNGRLDKMSQAEWEKTFASRENGVINAALGIMELIRSGKVNERAILYLNEGQVRSAANLDDLLKLTSMAAKSARTAFVGEADLRDLLCKIDTQIESCRDLSPAREADLTGCRERIASLMDRLVAARTEAAKGLVTDFPSADKKGKPLGKKAKLKALDKMRSSNRAFRFSMDAHLGNVSPSKMSRLRRWFDNLFGDKAGSVPKEAFEACRDLGDELSRALAELDLNTRLWTGGRVKGVSAELLDDLRTVTCAATDLTHTANNVVRNYKKGVYKAYVNHQAAIDGLFGESRRAQKAQTYAVTCQVGVGVEADLGLSKISVAADRKRDVIVTLLDSGGVKMTVLDGAAGKLGLEVGTSFGEIDAEVGASFQKGKTFTYKDFDAFVSDSFGKLQFPQLSGHKGEKLSKTTYSGKTGGNKMTRLMKRFGFLSFGSRVDTLAYANKIRQQGVYGELAKIIGTHAPESRADYRAFTKKSVGGGIGATFGVKDATVNAGLGVRTEFESQTESRLYIDFFDAASGIPYTEQAKAFRTQLESIRHLGTHSFGHDFAHRFLLKSDFAGELDAILGRQPAEDEDLASVLTESSERLLALIDDLQIAAVAEAPAEPELAERHWKDYATLLRGAALAQTLLETSARTLSESELSEFAQIDRDIRQAVRGLLDVVPKEIYDTKILFGSFALPTRSRQLETVELNVSVGSSSVTGRLIVSSPRKGAEDKLRPWDALTTTALEIDVLESATLEEIADFVTKTLTHEKHEKAFSISKKVSESLSKLEKDGMLPDLEEGMRLRFEFVDGKLSVFESMQVGSVQESKRSAKGPVNVHREKTFNNTKTRARILYDPTLVQMLGEAEQRLAGELGEAGNGRMTKFASQNAKSVTALLDALVKGGSSAENDRSDPSVSMAREIRTLVDETRNRLMTSNSCFSTLAGKYSVRLNDLELQLADYDTLGDAEKVRLGSEYLTLMTQILRLGSMAAHQAHDVDVDGLVA